MNKWLKYLQRPLLFLVVIALFAVLLFTHSQVRSNIGTNEYFGLPDIMGVDITDIVFNEEYPAFTQDGLTMYVSFGGAIRVVNETTGEEVWRNTSKDEHIQVTGSYDAAVSPLMITYRYEGESDITLYSGLDAAEKEQYSVYYSEDGKKLCVSYLFGQVGQDGILPFGITKDCMEKQILPSLNDDDKEYLLRRYILHNADTAKEEILENCPGVKKHELYYLENCSSQAMINRTISILAEAGMTSELYEKQCEITGEKKESYTESYLVTVEYWLENADIMVNIPCDEIKFHPENPLTKISLNGAATYNLITDEGQYFLPAGSGALQSFNSSLEINNDYRYYGANNLDKDVDKIESKFPFPIFGVLRENSNGLMGVIESGAEVATLNERFSYGASQLTLDLSLLEYGDSSVTVQQTSTVFNSSVFNKDFTVRYRTLKNGITPSEFACEYRDIIKSQGKLSKKQENTDSILLELVGNVKYSYQLGGILPVNETLILTDWEQSSEIYKTFIENKISPSVKITGYNKEGLFRQAPGKYNFSGKLGDKKTREDFLNLLDNNNANIFLDVNLSYSYVGTKQLFSGYNAQNKSARMPSNKVATYTIKSLSTGDPLAKAGTLNIVSPYNYLNYVKDYNKNLDSCFDISFGDSLLSLNVDYSEKNSYNRADTMEAFEEAADLIGKDRAIMTKNPVLPILTNISVTENLELLGENKYSLTKYFPFVQIVLHGHVSYTTDALNAKSNYEDELLTAIEMGSAVKYTITGKLDNLVSETEYDYLYYTDWNKWQETIINDSKIISELYEKIENAEIVSYNKTDGVAKTEYNNGISVYVNHNKNSVVIDGITIDAMSFTTN